MYVAKKSANKKFDEASSGKFVFFFIYFFYICIWENLCILPTLTIVDNSRKEWVLAILRVTQFYKGGRPI